MTRKKYKPFFQTPGEDSQNLAVLGYNQNF